MKNIYRILLISHDSIFNNKLKYLLESQGGYEILPNASEGQAGIEIVAQTKPDLVIVLDTLPDYNGKHILEKIIFSDPETKVIIISYKTKLDYINDCFHLGAKAYMEKKLALINLLTCLEKIQNNESYLAGPVPKNVLGLLSSTGTAKTPKLTAFFEKLTPREQEMAKLLVKGLTPKEIGIEIGISHKTVENHRTRLMKKLELKSMDELYQYAIKIGLIK